MPAMTALAFPHHISSNQYDIQKRKGLHSNSLTTQIQPLRTYPDSWSICIRDVYLRNPLPSQCRSCRALVSWSAIPHSPRLPWIRIGFYTPRSFLLEDWSQPNHGCSYGGWAHILAFSWKSLSHAYSGGPEQPCRCYLIERCIHASPWDSSYPLLGSQIRLFGPCNTYSRSPAGNKYRQYPVSLSSWDNLKLYRPLAW